MVYKEDELKPLLEAGSVTRNTDVLAEYATIAEQDYDQLGTAIDAIQAYLYNVFPAIDNQLREEVQGLLSYDKALELSQEAAAVAKTIQEILESVVAITQQGTLPALFKGLQDVQAKLKISKQTQKKPWDKMNVRERKEWEEGYNDYTRVMREHNRYVKELHRLCAKLYGLCRAYAYNLRLSIAHPEEATKYIQMSYKQIPDIIAHAQKIIQISK